MKQEKEVTKSESTEVVAQGSTSLAQPMSVPKTSFSEGVDRSDILMPMILLMQGQSELVGDEKAAVGDIVKSTSKKVIGNKNKPINFVPLLTFKVWRNFEKVGDKFEYRGQEPYFEKDKDLPWTYEKDGKTFRRDKSINVYVLLVEDVLSEAEAAKKLAETGEMPDFDAMCLPAMIGFTRTGFQTGRTLSTHFAMADNFQVPPWMATFKLTTHMEKNDKGQFYVFDVEKVPGKTDPTVIEAANKWYEILRAGQLKVDESGLSEATVKDVTKENVPF